MRKRIMGPLRSDLPAIILMFAAVLVLTGIATAQTASAAATKEYKRLVSLQKSLKKIPLNKENKEPYRSFLKKHDKDIFYSELSGEWYVRSQRFWNLQMKYPKLAIADKIAWTAAESPLGGECEGDISCSFSVLRMTYGEYLRLYPKGTHSRKAAKEVFESLSYIADDLTAKKNYYGPTEKSAKADFAKVIAELRFILTKVSCPQKTKALSQLKAIEAAFK